jgi:hypothetical protein
MRDTVFGGEDHDELSSWSFRLTGTLLVLMAPLFFIGRVLQWSQVCEHTRSAHSVSVLPSP